MSGHFPHTPGHMLWFIPLVLAADRKRLGLVDPFEIFAMDMQDRRNHSGYLDSMIPDWLQFLSGEEPLGYESAGTEEYLEGMLAEDLMTNLTILKTATIPVENGQRIASYLHLQAQKIQGTLIYALKHIPPADSQRWIEGLRIYVGQVVNNLSRLPTLMDNWELKAHEVFDVAFVAGLFPTTCAFVAQLSFNEQQASALSAIGVKDVKNICLFDFFFAHLLHSSHLVMEDETRAHVSLINNLMAMSMSETVFNENDFTELAKLVQMAPIGKRVALKFLKSPCILDMIKHSDGHWYGIKYGASKRKMLLFKMPNERMESFFNILQKAKVKSKEIGR